MLSPEIKLIPKEPRLLYTKWTKEQAWAWYNDHPRLLGCNFAPSTTINLLEMWQRETIDPETITRDLRWAKYLGFNTIRVYLHDLA